MSFFLRSGIGAQIRGFRNSGLYDVDVIATSEIDKDAIVSYAAIHCGLTPELIETYDYPPVDEMVEYLESRNIGYVFEKNKPYDWQKKRNSADLKKYYLASILSKNMGDISKIKKLPYADFVTYSFPCTDISIAGQIQGIERGKTRSGLLYEVERLLTVARERESLPKFLLLENVKNLVSKRFKPQFDEWCDYLSDLGYNTYWQVVNAKDCGIPQNRERVFAVSIRKDVDTGKFEFPQPFDIGIRLMHVIDLECDEKFILKSEAAEKALNEMNDNGTLDKEEEMWQELMQDRDKFTNYGIICNPPYEVNIQTETVGGQVCPTLTAGNCNIYRIERNESMNVEDWAIRKLTPTECYRLQGFTDEDVAKCKAVGMSDTQLYRQAGNSIVTNCIELLAEHFYKAQVDENYECYDEKFTEDRQLSF